MTDPRRKFNGGRRPRRDRRALPRRRRPALPPLSDGRVSMFSEANLDGPWAETRRRTRAPDIIGHGPRPSPLCLAHPGSCFCHRETSETRSLVRSYLSAGTTLVAAVRGPRQRRLHATAAVLLRTGARCASPRSVASINPSSMGASSACCAAVPPRRSSSRVPPPPPPFRVRWPRCPPPRRQK